MSQTLQQALRDRIVIFDGAMGTEIYRRNFFVNISFENLCLARPDVIRAIHAAYLDAGAEVLTTNSYGANRAKLMKFGLAEQTAAINEAAVKLAREAAGESAMVAASIGPVGELPSFLDPLEILSEQVSVLAKAAPDFLMFETLASLADLDLALKAAASSADGVPFALSFALDEKAQTAKGEPFSFILKRIAASPVQPVAIGLNCCSGPGAMLHALETVLPLIDKKLPLIAQPNAGSPRSVDNRMLYMCSPEYFTTYAMRYVQLGVRGIGGCCGTSPEHIADMARSVSPLAKHARVVEIAPSAPSVPLQDPVPTAKKSSFAAKLASGKWVNAVEIVPPQGYLLDATIAKANLCAEAGFDVINIPDGPRASSRVSTIVTAIKIQQEVGIETVLHCCCRDKNVIGIQADLLGCAAMGIHNILFITGDPPKLGDYPFASGVFDLDSIAAVKVQAALNRGVDFGGKSIGEQTAAFCLVGADPNAIDMERELRRTREKIAAGAEAVVTQPVFDSAPLLRFIESVPELADGSVPVIAGIWPLASLRNAEFMKNEVPGVVVPDSVMVRMARPETREEQRLEGIAIAREAVDAIRSAVRGIHVSAPFGNIATAIAVMKP
jgi:homocysteine S-methyltransferase